MKITLPVTIEQIATRVDNTIKIVIATQDLPPEDAVILFQLKGSLGYMMFSKEFETEMPENLPKPQAMEGKTPSQRLRDRMFVYFKESNIKNISFDNWYVNEVDRIGQAYLDKIQK
jgi:hypothetical protein